MNKYLWNASLEVLNFLPIQTVDPFTGVIQTGYGTPPGGGRSYRATIKIADPALEAALPALRRLAAPLFEHPKSAPTLHLTLTATGLDIEITGVERKSGGLSADARMRLVEVAAEADFARVTLDGEMAYLARQPTIRIVGCLAR